MHGKLWQNSNPSSILPNCWDHMSLPRATGTKLVIEWRRQLWFDYFTCSHRSPNPSHCRDGDPWVHSRVRYLGSKPDLYRLKGVKEIQGTSSKLYSGWYRTLWFTWCYYSGIGGVRRFWQHSRQPVPAKANEAICRGGELGFSLETSGGEWYDHQDRQRWPCLVSPPFNRLAGHQIRGKAHGNGSAPSLDRARMGPRDLYFYCTPYTVLNGIHADYNIH